MGGYKLFAFFLLSPLVLVGYYWVFGILWNIQGLMSQKYATLMMSESWSVQTALFGCGYSLVPMMVMVLVIMITRMFTVAGNTMRKNNTLFFTVNQLVLADTLEQNFLFVINLLGAASFYRLTIERMALLTAMFIVSRILYWVLSFISAYFDAPWLKNIAYGFTLINNLLLLVHTILAVLISSGFELNFLKDIKF